MIVYLITNQENGKQYVGQTVKTLDRRWKNHINDAIKGCPYNLHCSIRKHGPSVFSVTELHVCETKEEMDFVETFYIHLLRTKRPDGYNILETSSISGAHTGHKHTLETKNRMSISRKGREPWNKGKKMSPEDVEKNRQGHLGKPWPPDRKRNNGWLGKKPTKEHIEKIRLAKKGKGKPWSQLRRDLFNARRAQNGI